MVILITIVKDQKTKSRIFIKFQNCQCFFDACRLQLKPPGNGWREKPFL